MAGFLQNALKIRSRAEEAASDLPALMVQAQKAVASVLHGEHAQRKAGNGEKFWQFREYVPGDRPQDIDWRQSAKTDRVFIRQKEWQTTQDTIFWCSRYKGMDFHSGNNPSKADAAKVLTLALTILVTRAGDRAGLLGGTRPGRSEKTLENLGNNLINNQADEGILPSAVNPLPAHATFIQIGDFLSPVEEIKHCFQSFGGRADSGLVIQVLDPAELELPYDGRVVFEDPDGQNQELVNHVGSVRNGYQARIEEHRHALERLCRQQGWHYALHRTDADIADTLAVVWAQMSRSFMEMQA